MRIVIACDVWNPMLVTLLPIARIFGRVRLSRPLVGAAARVVVLAGQVVSSQNLDHPALPDRVLTSFSDLWTVPREQRSLPHRIRTEVVIYYFDAEWNSAWGECQGVAAFLPIGDSPTPLKAGQRVRIDGIILPMQERFVWEKTRLQVVEEGVDRQAMAVRNLSDHPTDLKARLVTVEGLIDSEKNGPTHITFNFLANGTTATGYALKGTNSPEPHFKAGDFIRMKCIYAPQLDKDGNLASLDLWVARPGDVEVIGSLDTDPRFARPATAIEDIQEDLPGNELICVTGTVHKHEPGKWVTLWGDTGQVRVESKQTQPLRLGDRVEAIGYPSVLGVQQNLRNGLYRLAPSNHGPGPVPASPPEVARLRVAEQIRDLTREESARHRQVRLRGVVTWSNPEKSTAYVEDASGGIRVLAPQWDAADSSKPGTIVLVDGVTAEGDFVPVVTNAVLHRVGWWNLNAQQGQLLSLEQALTGAEEGRWVEMRGYVREVSIIGGLRRIEMTTASGEVDAWVPSSRTLKDLEGAIVRLQGVCVAVANPRHQLTGIQILIPESKFILLEEPKASDVFAVPMRALESLRRFNIESALNRRMRTCGTVIMHAPGRYVYIQDGADAVFALSRQKDPLRPGDRVEVVGFPGNEGRRFLLREAVYRRVSTGDEPEPVPLSAMQSINLDLEGRLATADGVLLNIREKDGEARVLVQAKDSAFEASLDATATDGAPGLGAVDLGSRIAVTGVYEVQSDEYGKPRSFLLRLRSWDDIVVLHRPPWWTLARLLWVLFGVLLVSVVALSWGLLIAHKNRLLRQAQTQLQIANDKLEHRVQERTRELEEQVAAKERARAELAEAQENLVLTSRRAGMAEVATGVLHNVGNVLNSVNVSAGILSERLRRSSVESVAKAAALLRIQGDQLARFLTEDPKGKTLPAFLEKLGDVLAQDKRDMQTEIKSLAKNIDHIKIIVSMQQGYAKIGGVVEELDPRDLVEDAIQINNASLKRQQIQLIRNYHPVPSVLVDRHKVLQILVNLISNAKHALSEKASGRELSLGISAPAPDRVRITVGDNGAGIAPENLAWIFSQGFTTRKNGHGFGLHSGANAAKELGGSLTVESEGTARGATFTLELPAASSPAQEAAPSSDRHQALIA